ncbi:uncharacterized protein EDB91DRAFT_805441 [Suillus paluster]|uniref:uncharacterized protein n=1 Tax=Suillus paluster TaxID=48578 RepID=UPI001B879F1F|nr:uncharacterized protein EDB91DRAFT_805441 [Suillus paluster]KAG1729615.1 hypothetical protein EDB91DRAFT_805441 [Suillus paluster]
MISRHWSKRRVCPCLLASLLETAVQLIRRFLYGHCDWLPWTPWTTFQRNPASAATQRRIQENHSGSRYHCTSDRHSFYIQHDGHQDMRYCSCKDRHLQRVFLYPDSTCIHR